MEKSFSIVMDDDNEDQYEDKELLKKYSRVLSERKQTTHELSQDSSNSPGKNIPRLLSANDSDSDDNIIAPPEKPPGRLASAGPSGRQTVLRSRPINKPSHMSSESEVESDNEEHKTTKNVPGEYDPKKYENLDVNTEIKEIFQYITKYIPQPISLDHKFKPFVPEFLPAVGDIDAFLKVVPPSALLSGETFDYDQQLGLTVLDEPAANQSDSALLHLQLRAESVNPAQDSYMIVKKVDNVEKNVKVIDKWIKDISALHKSKTSPSVRYSEPMPDLDELMQEWPEEIEMRLREDNFPEPGSSSLEEYVEKVCELFQIPTKNKIHSLHLLFSLYAAVNSSQLLKNSQLTKNHGDTNEDENANNADQLVLD